MVLPYDNSQSRKYTCFCCGLEYKSYEEYKTHILENHKEGQDYVKCPLLRCGCPVRDIRSHFKNNHPHDPIPKTGMMAAIVWRDFGKKKTKKPKYKEGYYTSTKTGKDFKYRSGYEETVYQCLDAWDEVTTFQAEPFKIPYLFEGKAHNYIPDILIQFIDGHTEVWEIKPGGQTALPINQAKWRAAEQACATRGWTWDVYTEQKINLLKKKIKRQPPLQK